MGKLRKNIEDRIEKYRIINKRDMFASLDSKSNPRTYYDEKKELKSVLAEYDAKSDKNTKGGCLISGLTETNLRENNQKIIDFINFIHENASISAKEHKAYTILRAKLVSLTSEFENHLP